MKKFIKSRTRKWDKSIADDPVQDKLLDIIAAKKKGRKAVPAKAKVEETKPSNVINIMDALRASLAKKK